nr:hypothetical protein [Candidatus Sigynarchaeota archaeon]
MKQLFRFDRDTLSTYDFKSGRLASGPPFILGGLLSTGIVFILLALVDFVLYKIKYMEISDSLANTVNSIAPAFRIAVCIIIPLACVLVFYLFTLMVGSGFFFGMKSLNARDIGFKESFGIASKYMLLQSVVIAAGIAGNVLYFLPTLLAALSDAQVDTGNNVDIGLILNDLLSNYMVYFLMLAALSIPMHFFGLRVLDGWSLRHGLDRVKARVSFACSWLVVSGILLLLAWLATSALFIVFSSISIENNPLQA